MILPPPLSTPDILPPRTSLAIGTPKFGSTPFISRNTLLSLSAVDDSQGVGDGLGIGVASTYWALDGGGFTASTNFTVPTDGGHWISYYSDDTLGNVETIQSVAVAVDGTAPVSSIHTSQPAVQGSDGGPPVLPAGGLISFTAVDPISNGTAAGVNHSEYSINNGPTLGYSAAFGIGDGITSLRYRSIDNVGNTEDWLTVSYRGGTTFDNWRGAHFTADQLNDPAISGANANPAGDGVTNLAKYALAMDPWVSSRQGWPTGSVLDNHLVMEYTRVTAAVDVAYIPQKSSWMLGPWIAASDEILPRAVHATTQTLRIRDPDLVSQTPSGFMRLGLSLNAPGAYSAQAPHALTKSSTLTNVTPTAGNTAGLAQSVVSSDVSLAVPVTPAPQPPVAAPPDGPAPDFGRGNRRVALTAFPNSHSSAHAAIAILTPQGGEVHAKDGSGVIIAPGAMTSSRTITVAPLSTDLILSQDLIPVGRGARFGPAGARFNQSVTVELPYDRASLPAKVKEGALAIRAWNPDTRAWESLPSAVDEARQIVTAQCWQFTQYHLMAATAD